LDLAVLRSLVVLFALVAALAPGVGLGAVSGPASALAGAPTAAEASGPRPVLRGDFADPAVTVLGSGYVGFSTGSLVPRAVSDRPRGAWHAAGRGLVRLPSWSHADGDVWASDVARVGGWWLLYFAAPVHGIGEHGRCIGVARSRTALGGFVPVGGRPLVCPSYAKTPAAGDDVPQQDRSLPRAGVIDPSLFVEDGRASLVYKTDRIPSSIRLVPLTRSGLRVAGDSVELLRHDGVLENPVVVRRPEGYVMLLSQGDYGRCSYRTVWRRSASLLDWSAAEEGVLLDRATSGLCGPGGADVSAVPRGSRLRLFLHAWTCARRQCPPGVDLVKKRPRLGSQRPMYAAELAWPGGVPTVVAWR
jgi:arabinan endo-1,5-alpha-L-arabinosidase